MRRNKKNRVDHGYTGGRRVGDFYLIDVRRIAGCWWGMTRISRVIFCHVI
jgi:hypothetical protein